MLIYTLINLIFLQYYINNFYVIYYEEVAMQKSKYQVFVKVIELESITKAADALNYTQSGVSHIIKSLEKDLGFRLLVRNKLEFHLTTEGKEVFESIKKIAEWEENLFQTSNSILGFQVGNIRIGTCCSVSANWLPDIIKTFLEDYPNIEFELIDSDYDNIENLLLKDKIDCAFLPVPNSPDITHELLMKDKYFVVIPLDHPWNELDKIPITLFNNENFILPCEGFNYKVGKLFSYMKVNPNIFLKAKDDYGTLSLVKSGLGVTILSELFLKNFSGNYILKELSVPAYRNLGISYHAGRKVSPITKLFLDHAKKWVYSNYPQELNI